MKTFYSRRDTQNIDEILKKNPKLVPLYVNIIKNQEKTIISLSKHKGQILYTLNEKDSNNVFELLSEKKDDSSDAVKENVGQTTKKYGLKKSKQANLFGFLKKK